MELGLEPTYLLSKEQQRNLGTVGIFLPHPRPKSSISLSSHSLLAIYFLPASLPFNHNANCLLCSCLATPALGLRHKEIQWYRHQCVALLRFHLVGRYTMY